jgi:hypothetical protein
LAEAAQVLQNFELCLEQAISANDVNGARQTCEAVFKWGGETRKDRGAYLDLAELASALVDYLRHVKATLTQPTLDTAGNLDGIEYCNSMWVKVYSVLAGTPIYDSRVAGAIATIVETWRLRTGQDRDSLPVELKFPAAGAEQRRRSDNERRVLRRVKRRYPNAQDPGVLGHGTSSVRRWAGATVRLGWLMDAMLGGGAGATRQWELEAALFMAGADCEGINTAPPHVVAHLPGHPRATSGLHSRTSEAAAS